jgi:hypothetical protein
MAAVKPAKCLCFEAANIGIGGRSKSGKIQHHAFWPTRFEQYLLDQPYSRATPV